MPNCSNACAVRCGITIQYSMPGSAASSITLTTALCIPRYLIILTARAHLKLFAGRRQMADIVITIRQIRYYSRGHIFFFIAWMLINPAQGN